MKIKPQIYAQTLVELARSDNKKIIARNFIKKLQRNNQYSELHRILDLADEVAAKKNNKILIKIYSENPISSSDELTIKNKLQNLLKKEIIFKKYIKGNVTGILVKYNDMIIDFSLEGKVKRLKMSLRT